MSEETKDPETPPEPPKLEWQYRNGFGINDRMKEVIEATIKMAQSEVEKHRKKLRRLQYGR